MKTIIVVPCYNEADRLDVAAFLEFVRENPSYTFLFVNDGSLDGTADLLRETCGRDPDRLRLKNLDRNRGKAEAVRQGMLEGFKAGYTYVGFWDADLSTPLSEIPGFTQLLDERPTCAMVMGARVKLLGRDIRRHTWRHYLGRVFATVASRVLALPVYDTQCGAKLFRATKEVESLFAEPFLARWIFDVEILARLLANHRRSGRHLDTDTVVEIPLMSWIDVPGSKLKSLDFLVAIGEMWRIDRRYRASIRRAASSS